MTAAPARDEQILSAAYRVFTRKGYRTATVSEIAAEAGVSHGTFYNYFRNRRDVLDAVIDSAVGSLLEIIVPSDARPVTSADDLLDYYRDVLTGVLEYVARETRLVRLLLFDAGAVDAEMTARLFSAFSRLGAAAGAHLQEGVERGYLDPDLDTDVLGEGLTAMTLALVLPEFHTDPDTAAAQHLVDELTDFVRAGLTPAD